MYICLVSITLVVLTLFIGVLFAAVAITTSTTIALLTDPLAFSELDFFANIPVLLFTPPRDVSIAKSTVHSMLDRDVVEKGGRLTA